MPLSLSLKAEFEIDPETFIAGLPTTQELLDHQLDEMPSVLRDFTSGKYPHFVLSIQLVHQVKYRRDHPVVFWGVLVPTSANGPLEYIESVCAPPEPYLEEVRTRALATGDPEAIGELYNIVQTLMQGQWGTGLFPFTTHGDFAEQFAKAWETSVAVLDKWLDDDVGVENARIRRKELTGPM